MLDEFVMQTLRKLQDKCAEEKRAPLSVSINDILSYASREIRATLNRFVKVGKVTWYPNINQIPMFTIKE